MGEAINSVLGAIERLYQGFILRDLLGFVLPGAISLMSLWSLFGSAEQIPACDNFAIDDHLKCILTVIRLEPTITEILVFLGMSYLAGWVLQGIHYGIVDAFFQIARLPKQSFLDCLKVALFLLFWPLVGIFLYTKIIAKSNNQSKGLENLPSLIMRGALAPDNALEKIKTKDALSIVRRESSSYTERVTALMLMTSNTAIAGAFLLTAWNPGGSLLWIGIAIILLLLLEHWRLWYARNLRHEIYVGVASNLKSSDNPDEPDRQNFPPPKPTDQ